MRKEKSKQIKARPNNFALLSVGNFCSALYLPLLTHYRISDFYHFALVLAIGKHHNASMDPVP